MAPKCKACGHAKCKCPAKPSTGAGSSKPKAQPPAESSKASRPESTAKETSHGPISGQKVTLTTGHSRPQLGQTDIGSSVSSGATGDPHARPKASIENQPTETILAIFDCLKAMAETGDGRIFGGVSRASVRLHSVAQRYLWCGYQLSSPDAKPLHFARTMCSRPELASIVEFVGYGLPGPKGMYEASKRETLVGPGMTKNMQAHFRRVVNSVFLPSIGSSTGQRWLVGLGLTTPEGPDCDQWSIMAVILNLVPKVKNLELLYNRPQDSIPTYNNDYYATGLLADPTVSVQGVNFPKFSHLNTLCLDMFGIDPWDLAPTLRLPSLRILVLGNLSGRGFPSYVKEKFPIHTSNVQELVMHRTFVCMDAFTHLMGSFKDLKLLDLSARGYQYPQAAPNWTTTILGSEFVAVLQQHCKNLTTLKVRGQNPPYMKPLKALGKLTEIMVSMASMKVPLESVGDDAGRASRFADYFPPSLKTLHIVQSEYTAQKKPKLSQLGERDYLYSFLDNPKSHPNLKSITVVMPALSISFGMDLFNMDSLDTDSSDSEPDDLAFVEPLKTKLGARGIEVELEDDNEQDIRRLPEWEDAKTLA